MADNKQDIKDIEKLLRRKNARKVAIVMTGLIMGVLFSLQAKSFSDFQNVYERENKVNIFREIQIIKNSNQKLSEEIAELKDQLDKSNNKEEILKNLSKDIEKNKLLKGEYSVEGTGIEIVIEGDIAALWFTDIVNELFSAGAEMVSVNNYMLTNQNIGFDTLPNGKILLKDNILEGPYNFKAIGDSSTMFNAFNQSGGIISRLKESFPNLKLNIKKVDTIRMDKVDNPNDN